MRSSAQAELAAAGIRDPGLQRSYLACRSLFAGHGRTYFLATLLLPRERRPAVHALYGFARHADEIVDHLDESGGDTGGGESAASRAARLTVLGTDLVAALAGEPTTNPLLPALADTARTYRIDTALFTDFLTAMAMDTHVTSYATFAELDGYVHGSAAVIGRQMLPVLGTVVPRQTAEVPAAALGVAFQLTNFLRDVGEDLVRGRVYLPADELAAFGVDRELLEWCRRAERVDPRVRAALAHLVAHNRTVYARAEPGIAMLEPASRACVRTAFLLYRQILDEFESAGYPLHRRVAVSGRSRIAVAVPGAARALAARGRLVRRPSTGRGA